jgi:hypothetical protein
MDVNPMRESWGGSFEKFSHSPRVVFNPKQAEILSYKFTSNISGFPVQQGTLVVDNPVAGKELSNRLQIGY